MRTSDHAEASRPRDEAPKFPNLKAAEVYRLRFKHARRLMIGARLQALEEAAVVDVVTDADWPAMGTGLALFVDGQALLESEQLAPQRYRFIVPPGVAWNNGAELALGLAGSGAPRAISPSKLKLRALDERLPVQRE